jgi:5-formyltetrahydrofolate cyclo-ligase
LEIINLLRMAKPPQRRIPNFNGAAQAVQLLGNNQEWQRSRIIFSSSDSATERGTWFALADKKTFIMASPKLKEGYLLINPNVKNQEKIASTIKGAFR